MFKRRDKIRRSEVVTHVLLLCLAYAAAFAFPEEPVPTPLGDLNLVHLAWLWVGFSMADLMNLIFKQPREGNQ